MFESITKRIVDTFWGSQTDAKTEPSSGGWNLLGDPLVEPANEQDRKERAALAAKIREAYERKGPNLSNASWDETAERRAFRKMGLTRYDELAAVVRDHRSRADAAFAKDPKRRVIRRPLGHGAVGIFTRHHGNYIDIGKYDPVMDSGSFKTFNQGIDIETHERVALLKAKGNRGVEDMEREENLRDKMGDLPHVTQEGTRLLHNLVVQKIYGGTLHEQGADLSMQEKLTVAVDLLTGLRAMHDKGFVHRDLKSENVLLDENKRGFIGDLGLATDETKTTQAVGTPTYVHPKQYRDWLIESNKFANGPLAVYRTLDEAKTYDTYAMGMVLGDLFGDSQSVRQSMKENLRAYEAINYEDPDYLLYDRAQDAKKVVKEQKGRYRKELKEHAGGRFSPKKDTPVRIALEMRHIDRAKIGSLKSYIKRFERLRG